MDDSDYSSADSISDGDDEKDFSDYESITDEEIIATASEEQPATHLSITDAATVSLHNHNKKNKRRAISIKNAFRRGRNVKKSLDDLRRLVEEAIQSNLLIGNGDEVSGKEISLWGIPLLPSKGHAGTDVILLKFLKARDLKVAEAYEMICRTMIWRRREKIDEILEEEMEIGKIGDKVVFWDGTDREGRPLCYNVYAALEDAEFYREVFGTEMRRVEFVRWWIQGVERIIRSRFRFGEAAESGGEAVSLVQISDLRNLPAKVAADLMATGKKLLSVFQEHYPEIIHRNIIVNPPSPFNMISGFLSQNCSAGTRKKFVVARQSRVTSRLLKYIEPQNIPVQYGGLKRENDEDFHKDEHGVLGTVIKGGQHGRIEIPAHEDNVTIVWDVMVVGWDVIYKEEFVPDDEGSYKVQLHKEGRIAATIRNSYYISEPGKIVITIRNSHFGKKRVFWRFKCKLTLPAYAHNQLQSP